MAGRGSRLRPHTLTVPKPLIPIAGKPIVHRLVEDIASVINQDIVEIAFIIHENFGQKTKSKPRGNHHTVSSLVSLGVNSILETIIRQYDFRELPFVDALSR